MASNRISCLRGDIEMDEDEDDELISDGSDSWDEMEDDNQTLVDCFFCTNTFRNVDNAVSHCHKEHGLDLPKLKTKHKMDCYSYIKFVNFIRLKKPTCDDIMSCAFPLWSDDKYLTPVNHEDPWLMFDFDDVEELVTFGDVPRTGYHVNAEGGRITLSDRHFAELQKTIKTLNSQIKEKDEVISQLVADMQQMKVTLNDVVAGESHQVLRDQNVRAIRLEDDEEYFSTYAHFGIHHEMLSDEVRTTSYRDALCLNLDSIDGRTLLDLGCGTGILSMFAAKAGAARVFGIDQSDIIYHAMDIVRENQLCDKITLLKGRLEDTELPVPQVDVIVSEWMGYFLLFEAMLDSVIYARDKYLQPGGLLLPNRCSLSLVGGCDQVLHTELLEFWSDVYGFKMSSLRGDVVREPQTRVISPDSIATTPAQLCMLDLMTVTTDCMDFDTDFQFVAIKNSQLTCIIGYFDVFFDLPNPVTFSTSPTSKPTHWKQTVFLIKNPIKVEKGEVVQGKLTCRRNQKELRSLIVTITLGNVKQKYLLS